MPVVTFQQQCNQVLAEIRKEASARRLCNSKSKSTRYGRPWWSFLIELDLLGGTTGQDQTTRKRTYDFIRHECQFNCDKAYAKLLHLCRQEFKNSPLAYLTNQPNHLEIGSDLLREICLIVEKFTPARTREKFVGVNEDVFVFKALNDGAIVEERLKLNFQTKSPSSLQRIDNSFCLLCHRPKSEERRYCNFHSGKNGRTTRDAQARSDYRRRIRMIDRVYLNSVLGEKGAAGSVTASTDENLVVKVANVKRIMALSGHQRLVLTEISRIKLPADVRIDDMNWPDKLLPIFNTLYLILRKYHFGKHAILSPRILDLKSGWQLPKLLLKELDLFKEDFETDPIVHFTPSLAFQIILRFSYFQFLRKLEKKE
ncbi:MAG: hypothetical protein AAF431_07075 [Pseudomonadota bacterium]